MLEAEYSRFLQTLCANDTSDNVRKIANLVLNNMDTLIPLSTAHGQRIKEIVKLAQENWNSISSKIEPLSEQQTTTQSNSISRLKKLSVGPFRGFAKPENFDLDSLLVLIYGPNGTGKSSFCEALEYALLGSVAEAENKRFRAQQEYLKNAHTKRFTEPNLIGVDNHGKEIQIFQNENLFRFCFVEKNRIDSFSRIAAQTPAKQTELISTLFGLDAFTDFVRKFTDEIDEKYIDIKGAKAQALAEKRDMLAGYQQQIKTIIPENINKIEHDEAALSNKYREGYIFPQMVAELNGSEDTVSLIKQLEDELEKPMASKSNLTDVELQTLKRSIEADIEEQRAKQATLSRATQQVSFKRLYEAVTKIKEGNSNTDQCPACQTPLAQVRVNPFEHADTELKNLEHLGQLEEAVKNLESSIITSLERLSEIIKACCANPSENSPLTAFKDADKQALTVDWWHSFHQEPQNGLSPWKCLEGQVKQLEAADKEIERNASEFQEKKSKLTQLREFESEIVKLQTRRETAVESQKKAQEEIEKFDIENANLIADVEAEKSIITQNQDISSAYSTFVKKINKYKDSLPSKLVANLGETVVELYNSFNRNDPTNEQLAEIRLPLQQNQRIEISFKDSPTAFFDALHVLSEGHIRCIGLAILAAKNIKENCPLVIFDDPVNAIDDDHRESIRRAFFEDAFFTDKQIIFACHGEEFFKDIQNLLPAKKAQKSKKVTFLPKNGENNIRVDFNCSSRNYITTARTHYDKSEIRDALSKSRQALESLAKGKAWGYVSKHGDGNLSIKLRSATAPIELRNLTEQLKSKISCATFSDRNKTAVLNPIESLLGVGNNSREWRYLNKGTHEEADRAEFDRQTVEQIITALEQLDAALG